MDLMPSAQDSVAAFGRRRRRPWLAVILNVCVAGLGQAYSGFLARGLVLHLAWQGLGLISLFALVRLKPLRLNLFVALCICLSVWLLITLDAFRCAKRNSRGYELRWYNRWYVYFLFFVVAFLASRSLAATIRSNYMEAFNIPTSPMMPTVLIGDHIIVDKRAYRASVANRGDLVIFPSPENPRVTFLKRVVGLPGETIEIRAKRVLLNGAAIEEPYAYYSEPPGGPVVPGRDVLPALKLPPDEFFLLGDNRDHSYDSRFFGPVARTHILGKAKLIYFSWDPTTRHIRWDRLWQPLAGQQRRAELAGQAIMGLADKGYMQKAQPRLVAAPQPVYPSLARSARIQGVVKLQALIDTDGSIAHLSLISGHPLLVKAAMDAVQHWRYEPTVVNGKAVTVITEIDVNFKLAPQGDKTETPVGAEKPGEGVKASFELRHLQEGSQRAELFEIPLGYRDKNENEVLNQALPFELAVKRIISARSAPKATPPSPPPPQGNAIRTHLFVWSEYSSFCVCSTQMNRIPELQPVISFNVYPES